MQSNSLSSGYHLAELPSYVDSCAIVFAVHNRKGDILKINHLGSQLLNDLDRSVLHENKGIYSFFKTLDRWKLSHNLEMLCRGAVSSCQQESKSLTRRGGEVNLLWEHSICREGSENNFVSVGINISERKMRENRMAWRADHDSLTGLYNRHYFIDVFSRMVKHCIRYNRSGALLFIDLDNFKQINDAEGHMAGDRLIQMVGRILTRESRETDVVARIGGDEFIIACQDMDELGAVHFVQKLSTQLSRICWEAGKPIATASVGVSLFPRDGDSVDELLTGADMAMYQAKNMGFGKWSLYSGEIQLK